MLATKFVMERNYKNCMSTSIQAPQKFIQCFANYGEIKIIGMRLLSITREISSSTIISVGWFHLKNANYVIDAVYQFIVNHIRMNFII